MVLSALALLFLGLGGWGVWAWLGHTEERVADYVAAGVKLLRPGSYADAIEQFDRALQLDPDSFDAYYQRAMAHKNLSELGYAAEDFEAALKIRPNSVEALSALGAIHRELGDHEHALEEFTRAIALQPTPDAYYQRGSTYQQLGLHEKAIADFTWVIDALREAPWVYFARADSKRALGDEEGAKQDEDIAYSFDRSDTLH